MPRHRPSTRRATLGGGVALLALVICAFVAISVTGFRPLGAHAAEDAVSCTLSVPADPLSARGLATPYELSGSGCAETDPAHAAFVQATVIDPATGHLFNYNPLVVTSGTRPAVAPAVPTLPARAVVGIWFGFNGDQLVLRGADRSLRSGRCVNGAAGSVFGQFAYCNAPAFFTAANRAIRSGMLTVPALGTGTDGQTCPTTRDFGIVDQDQSDNVTSKYIIAGDQMAQATTANQAQLSTGRILTNASDNGLVDNKIDPAIGCSPWTAPDLADGMRPSNSLALDELQAAAHQASPAALVPVSDPMVLDGGGQQSRTKTDAYRAGVDMPSLSTDRGPSPTRYCTLMVTRGWARMQLDKSVLLAAGSPDTGADSLYTFLGARLMTSYDQLGCAKLLNMPNPIQVKLKDGVAVDVAKGAAALTQPAAPTRSPSPARTSTATTAAPTPSPTVTHSAAAPAASPTASPTASAAPSDAPSPTGSAAPSSTAPSPTPSAG